jgi:acetylornithine aminotransferase
VPGQETLATKLTELAGMTNVFFCCTGLEANEAALKLARKFGHDKGIERPEIVVYEAAFHGRSIATLSATGNHGTTFGGNPLAMRAGIETIRIMEEHKLLENAATVGAHLKAALERELGDLPGVKEVRGQGLMIGIELDRPCGVILNRACDAGLLLSVTADKVIRLVPPLILSIAEADEIVAILAPIVKNFLSEPAAQ